MPSNNVIIFDLDETLGYFVQFGIFIDCLEEYYNRKICGNEFFYIMDLYPEFTRPYIINILQYILEKKKSKNCDKVMIYTNNQGERLWVENIKNYFEYKINNILFDKIIAAFKVDGVRIEPNRTSHNKSVEDIYRCVNKLPKNIRICFVDDQYHDEMINELVYYIKVEPYFHSIDFMEMMNRYIRFNNIEDYKFTIKMKKLLSRYNYKTVIKDKEEYIIDGIVGKKLFLHIKKFFNKNIKKTQKIREKNSKTFKKY